MTMIKTFFHHTQTSMSAMPPVLYVSMSARTHMVALYAPAVMDLNLTTMEFPVEVSEQLNLV